MFLRFAPWLAPFRLAPSLPRGKSQQRIIFVFSFLNIPCSLRLFFAYTLDAHLFLVGLCYYFTTLSLKMQ
jgi:hypothetical protein